MVEDILQHLQMLPSSGKFKDFIYYRVITLSFCFQPKEYSCCVPACQTRGTYSSFLSFPTDPNERQQWISAIPNLDCVVHHKFLICKDHFKKGEVIKNGCAFTVASDVIPSVFSQNIDDHFKRAYSPKFMFEIMDRDVGPDTHGRLERLATEDFIVDFFYLQNTYKEKLGGFMTNWHVSFADNYAFFYFLSLVHVAKIKCSIKINDRLLVQVALGGRIMDPLDLTWILPATSKITRWSQLKVLLFEFGVPNTQGNDVISDVCPAPQLS